jgi:uncharacterized MAPEG superfamily protein
MDAAPYVELKLLGAAVVLGVVHLLLAAFASTRDRGLKWNAGPRDRTPDHGVLAGRLERAFNNFRETFPLFAASLLAAYLAGDLGPLTYWGAWIYLLGRVAYLPLYAAGVPFVRSVAWLVSMVGFAMVLVALLS